MQLTVDEKQKVRLMAENFVKRLHFGKIVLWLVVLLPVWELLYLYRAAS